MDKYNKSRTSKWMILVGLWILVALYPAVWLVILLAIPTISMVVLEFMDRF